MFFLNSVFLDDLVLMKYSLLNFSGEIVQYLFTQIISLWKVLFLIIVFIGLFFITRFEFTKEVFFNKKVNKIFLQVISFFSILILIFFHIFISNIYVNTSIDLWYLSTYDKIELDENNLLEFEYNQTSYDLGFKDYSQYSLDKNQKVLVFLMEQTSYDFFIKDIKTIPKERNFFEITKQNSHWFTNYYTNNQDSRTAVWTMFNSIFIPFEAYVNGWNKYYGYVLDQKNLIEYFNINDFSTYVVSSMYEPSLLLGAYNWSDFLYLRNFDSRNDDFFCIQEYEYQKGCEDNILLKDLKQLLLQNKNQDMFLFQEMIYGHGQSYMDAIGKTRTEYYNDYFLEVYNFLKMENMLQNTTILILSDHGDKGYFSKKIWNYKIPLIVINQDLEYEEINNLYSQLEFKNILLEYLGDKNISKIKLQHEKFIVGQTNSNFVNYVDNQGNYFISRNFGNDFFIREVNGLTQEQIISKLYEFKVYQNNIKNKSKSGQYYCKFCTINNQKVINDRLSLKNN